MAKKMRKKAKQLSQANAISKGGGGGLSSNSYSSS